MVMNVNCYPAVDIIIPAHAVGPYGSFTSCCFSNVPGVRACVCVCVGRAALHLNDPRYQSALLCLSVVNQFEWFGRFGALSRIALRIARVRLRWKSITLSKFQRHNSISAVRLEQSRPPPKAQKYTHTHTITMQAYQQLLVSLDSWIICAGRPVHPYINNIWTFLCVSYHTWPELYKTG